MKMGMGVRSDLKEMDSRFHGNDGENRGLCIVSKYLKKDQQNMTNESRILRSINNDLSTFVGTVVSNHFYQKIPTLRPSSVNDLQFSGGQVVTMLKFLSIKGLRIFGGQVITMRNRVA